MTRGTKSLWDQTSLAAEVADLREEVDSLRIANQQLCEQAREHNEAQRKASRRQAIFAAGAEKTAHCMNFGAFKRARQEWDKTWQEAYNL